jgi:GNAT superfamily N-acetyltransferase
MKIANIETENRPDMTTIKRTTSDDADFQALVVLLDRDLAIRDGDEHDFYHQFNKIDALKNVVVAYIDNIAVGCGAFKEYESGTVEIKRMYTLPEHRGKRIAAKVLTELEQWAAQLNYTTCILETGKKQPEAIRLYVRSGYTLIPNYGQYANVENSVCMRKEL